LVKTIGRIAHSLTYYGNVTDLAPPDLREEARQAYRDQAASLRTSINVIPMYAHLARLGLVRSRTQIRAASRALIGLSNDVGTERFGGEATDRRRREITENLGIELY
jgi:hypothetical protein